MSSLNSCLTGNELITGAEEGLEIIKFWRWAYSDILSNRNRSIFSEFIVAQALNVTENPRIEWDAVDIRYKGKKIEVKSAAYIQNWHQNSLSNIRFDISKKKSWESETSNFRNSAERNSDCYVFCLYTEKFKEKKNVTDINKWEFYVVSSNKINKVFGDQKTVSLKRIKNLCAPIAYNDLKNIIEATLII